MSTPSPYTILTRHGSEIKQYINPLAKLRISIFREFPYIYDGSPEYEQNYLTTYVNSKDSIAIFIMDGRELVGASTGLPLADETDVFIEPFRKQGYNPEQIFYCGESILRTEYRGRGIYSTFIKEREHHAKALGRFDTICFCAVVRGKDHPLRPENYKPLDDIWKKFGYKKQPHLKTRFAWKDLNEEQETKKDLVFWLKKL